jgi:hypothetical protein
MRDSTVRYNDGQYHVENCKFDYLGGYAEWAWTVVTVYGEPVQKNGISMRFRTEEDAKKYADKLNQCADGAVIRNME